MGKRKQKEEEEPEKKEVKKKKSSSKEEEEQPKEEKASSEKGDSEKKESSSNDGKSILDVLTFTPPSDAASFEKSFSEIASKLLNEYVMMIKGKPHRFVEVEFYWTGPNHMDPFTHQDEDQKKFGTWYFHKSGKGYKGGTYKGLDIAFGNKTAFGGILIRAIEPEGGKLVEGPCMCVDTILKENGAPSIQDFVKTFDSKIHNPAGTSPLYIAHKPNLEQRKVYQSGRVGLTLKKTDHAEERKEYILKPYRFFTNPDKLKKGKPYIICALAAAGNSEAEIKKIASSPADTISRIVTEFNKGKKGSMDKSADVQKAEELARLYGAWIAAYAKK